MNHKEDILQLILEVEAYAKAQKLSMRILDSIEECRQHLYKEDLSWQEIRQQLDEVMESVELKAQQTDLATYGRNKNNVSVEKVQTKVRRMAEDCHRENLDSVAAIAEKKNLNVKECIRKMEEISHTEAHFDEMIDENRYVDFFQKVKNSYERDMSKVTEDLFDDISSNYDHMADHMRSMFQSMDGYIDGIGNEKFYREYESRKDGIRNQVISEVHTDDFGGSVIMEFSDKTKKIVHKKAKKMSIMKNILSVVPVVIMIIISVFVINSVISKVYGMKDEIDSVCQELEIDNNNPVSSLWKIYQSNKDLPSEFIKKTKDIFKTTGDYLFISFLFIVGYSIYLLKLKKWCKRRICENCGEYLHTELAAFAQKDEIRKKADKAISQIVEDCEQQYLAILNSIFAGTKYEEKDTEEVSGFDDLQRKWNRLKYN